jgi:hypothetical protein
MCHVQGERRVDIRRGRSCDDVLSALLKRRQEVQCGTQTVGMTSLHNLRPTTMSKSKRTYLTYEASLDRAHADIGKLEP